MPTARPASAPKTVHPVPGAARRRGRSQVEPLIDCNIVQFAHLFDGHPAAPHDIRRLGWDDQRLPPRASRASGLKHPPNHCSRPGVGLGLVSDFLLYHRS